MTRDEAKDLIRQHGGSIVGTISAKTDFLLVGSKAGSKLAKAQKLGIQVVNEQEFANTIR